ncbi:SixA phosphatase family protein [Sphingobacterium suaedae]|uniref:SixA phosphatase family protein n=1 Tax=Sphingobacterium suaedae TaxID=1686402 RepID=A0ABW5KMM2_9SPHI
MEKKALYIIRHAKAEEHGLAQKDFDRNLVDKGIERAKQTAEELKKRLPHNHEKTMILASTANRAAQTAQIFCEVLGYPAADVVWEPRIYEAHYLMLMKRINDVPARFSHVLLVGHNPGLSDFVDYVTNTYVNLKTSAIARLELDEGIDYSTVSANTATLQQVICKPY